MMRSEIFPCMSSCWVVQGPTPGEILKSKNAGAGHFAMRSKSQIYLNYAYLQMFQRRIRNSPFIPGFFSISLRPGMLARSDALMAKQADGCGFDPHAWHIFSWRFDHEKKSTTILSLPLTQEGRLSVTGVRMCTKYW